LPDFGWVLYDYSKGVGWGYKTENDDEGIDNFYDILNDKGDLPAYTWNFWLEYFGVSIEQAKTYAKSMTGWNITNESEGVNYDDDPEYSCNLKKDDDSMVAALHVGSEGKYTFKVSFAKRGDDLY
jgi:hypothetical protein